MLTVILIVACLALAAMCVFYAGCVASLQEDIDGLLAERDELWSKFDRLVAMSNRQTERANDSEARRLVAVLEVRRARKTLRETDAALRLALAIVRHQEEQPIPYALASADEPTPLHDAVRGLR